MAELFVARHQSIKLDDFIALLQEMRESYGNIDVCGPTPPSSGWGGVGVQITSTNSQGDGPSEMLIFNPTYKLK